MKSYPLPEHEVLEYPHNCYGWDDKKNAAITTMSEAKIRKELASMQKHERFLTVWVDGIDQRHMNQPLPFPVRSLRYAEHGFALNFPSRMVASANEFDLTWFDLWRVAGAFALKVWMGTTRISGTSSAFGR